MARGIQCFLERESLGLIATETEIATFLCVS